jgi:hypothetical protein
VYQLSQIIIVNYAQRFWGLEAIQECFLMIQLAYEVSKMKIGTIKEIGKNYLILTDIELYDLRELAVGIVRPLKGESSLKVYLKNEKVNPDPANIIRSADEIPA